MTNLTEKESLFLKALIDDYFERGSKSFLEILFDSKFIHKNDAKQLALDMFELNENREFINNSLCFLERNNGHIIGKKGEFFFSTCKYREILSLGRKIQDIPYYINFNDLSYLIEVGGDISDTDYSRYITDYVQFCEEYGLRYCSHLKKDFDSDIFIIDKEEVIFEELFDQVV